MAENKPITKTDGLIYNTSPTGTVYKIVPVEWNPALKKIVASIGALPAFMSGMYTSDKRAQEDITKYLLERLDESDKIKAKRA